MTGGLGYNIIRARWLSHDDGGSKQNWLIPRNNLGEWMLTMLKGVSH